MHAGPIRVIGPMEKIGAGLLSQWRSARLGSLAAVTHEGSTAPGFEAVGTTFDSLVGRYRGGGALAVRLGGELVVDIWTGHADPRGTRPWTPDTLAISFSTTKGVASTVAHRLAD